MSEQSPVPEDHPMKIAWEQYKLTDEYANTKNWATYPRYVDGSLWAAFVRGWEMREGRDD